MAFLLLYVVILLFSHTYLNQLISDPVLPTGYKGTIISFYIVRARRARQFDCVV